ncbi:MAG: BNR repeat-containing protein, partial [Planctomycetaceae bacterium]
MAIFRHSAVDSFGDRQVAGWYDGEGRVCLGERRLGESVWRVDVTDLRGRVTDAHNVISLAFDGAGGLHMSWDHHGDPLRYMRVAAGGGLSSGERGVMLGRDEERVTYPEFYRLPGGDLLFFYRDGASGAGNLVLNRYRLLPSGVGEWQRVQSNLIDGEGERNAYWQACADGFGVIHLSWVWRETPDVVTNH